MCGLCSCRVLFHILTCHCSFSFTELVLFFWERERTSTRLDGQIGKEMYKPNLLTEKNTNAPSGIWALSQSLY